MRNADCGLRIALLGIIAAAPLGAQSVLYRSPNLGGTWVPDPAVVQFNFVHRFSLFEPGHVVANAPTFTLAAGIFRRVGVGLQLATHSYLVQAGAGSQSSNETELFARWRVWGAAEGQPGLHVTATPAYNFLAKSVDGELGVDWTHGAVTLEGAARVVSKALGRSTAKAALAGGIVARLSRYVAVSADLGSFVSSAPLAAWSAGIDFLIPGSPHTFSLEVSNALTSTIQGNSIGLPQKLYGFEFTIPLHLARFSPWFHPHRQPALPEMHVTPTAAAAADTVVHIRAFKYQTDTLTIAVGQTVGWVNDDPVAHAVVFTTGDVDSGLIPQGAEFRHTFTAAGTYHYHCTPHPYMTAVVVVK